MHRAQRAAPSGVLHPQVLLLVILVQLAAQVERLERGKPGPAFL